MGRRRLERNCAVIAERLFIPAWPASPDWDLFQSLHAVLEAGSFSAAARLRRPDPADAGPTHRPAGAAAGRAAVPAQPARPAAHRPGAGAAARTWTTWPRPPAPPARDASGAADRRRGRRPGRRQRRWSASRCCPRILTRFREAHPGIDMELMLSNKNDDLTAPRRRHRRAHGPPDPERLVAKKVGDVKLGFYATPEYVARKGDADRPGRAGDRTR